MNNNLIDWIVLDSRKINKIGYFKGNLYVEYQNKGGYFKKEEIIYEYLDVPERIYRSILNKDCLSRDANQPSHGATLYDLVEKNQQYRFNKIIVKI